MAGGGGVTLFSLGEHLDWMSLTLCMIGLIVFTIIFEVMLHNLEHRITVRFRAAQLHLACRLQDGRLSRDVMNVHRGLVVKPESLMDEDAVKGVQGVDDPWLYFVCLSHDSAVYGSPNNGATYVRAQPHLDFFGRGVLCDPRSDLPLASAEGEASLGRNVPYGRDRSVAKVRACSRPRFRGLSHFTGRYNNTSFFKLPKLWYDLFGRGKVREEMGFHIAKSLFLRVHSLPKNFDFAKYLRRSLTQHITDQLDVKVGARTVVVSSPATGS